MAAKTAVPKTRRVPTGKSGDTRTGKPVVPRVVSPTTAPAKSAPRVARPAPTQKTAVSKPAAKSSSAKVPRPSRGASAPAPARAAVVPKVIAKPTKPAAKMPAKVAAKPVRASVATAASDRKPAKTQPPRGAKARVRYVAPSLREVRVKELDPVARCGPDTSVELLYRVDERLDGRSAGVHLVFFDRYGWYCVHGRTCAAVADVHQDLRAQRRSVPRLAAPTTRAAGR